MFSFRRRRLYAFAVFIVVVGSIFLCFQFFSIRVLHSYSGAGSDPEHRLGRGAMPRMSNLDVAKFIRRDYGRVKKTEKSIEELTEREVITPAACTSNCSVAHPVVGLNTSPKSRLIVDGMKFKLSPDKDQVKLPGIKTFFDSWDSLEKYYASTQLKGAAVGASSPNVLPYRGVPDRWRHLYEPAVKGSAVFTCLFSREIIPMTQVNDDYCDCKDSTDEPGTSACPHSRFYCSFQSSSKSKWLPPSRVNDGLCDCCDGTDEWAGTLVPQRNHIADSRSHYGVYHAPCVDRCAELRAAEADLVEMRRKGALLKVDYAMKGSKQHNPNMLYGIDGEFYPLSQKCWSLEIMKYTYSVCPFGPIKQHERGGAELVIGQVASWSAYQQGVDLRLSLDNGDGTNCPDRKKRSTNIIFQCGLEDKVDSLSESETCVYTVYFSTPAAC